MKIDLIIGPLELPDHPKRAAEGQQHPEQVLAPLGRAGIQQQAGIGQEWQDALHEIAEGIKRLRAAL